MSEFEYDCLQKKRLAGQARRRKCGSKSKKCNLPSDRLTNKQWKDKCGPVLTYNLNKPMKWDDFKQMPVDIQAQYITNLQKKFGVTAVDLGNMFGVRALTVRKHANSNGLGIEFPRGHAMNAMKRAEWNSFLDIFSVTDPNATNHTELESVSEYMTESDAIHLEEGESDAEKTQEIALIQPKKMNMKQFTLKFDGAIDVNMISNSMRLILGDNAEGELEIICNLV